MCGDVEIAAAIITIVTDVAECIVSIGYYVLQSLPQIKQRLCPAIKEEEEEEEEDAEDDEGTDASLMNKYTGARHEAACCDDDAQYYQDE
jgi:hypothetical protein